MKKILWLIAILLLEELAMKFKRMRFDSTHKKFSEVEIGDEFEQDGKTWVKLDDHRAALVVVSAVEVTTLIPPKVLH